MDQYEFVAGAYEFYHENGISPGDPNDGKWELAHFPIPDCKDGTEVIPLLREHHCIQGLLQSEEFNHPCIWGDELPFLQEKWHPLFHKWRSELGRHAASFVSYEERAKKGRRTQAYFRTLPPEEFAKIRARATATLLERHPNHFSTMGKRARELETQEVRSARGHALHTDRLPDGRSANAVELNLRTNSTKVRCLVTGYISTPGPLSIYQRKRGIDTKLREVVESPTGHFDRHSLQFGATRPQNVVE